MDAFHKHKYVVVEWLSSVGKPASGLVQPSTSAYVSHFTCTRNITMTKCVMRTYGEYFLLTMYLLRTRHLVY